MASGRRVVVTGCGVVTAAGNELEPFWDALMEGKCFIRPLEHFTSPDMEGLVGAEVHLAPADDLPSHVDRDSRRSRCEQLALAAARRAVHDATISHEFLARAGVAVGSTLAEERQVADLSERWAVREAESVDDGFFDRCDSHRLAAFVARQHGMQGPAILCAAACSSGNTSLALSADLIASGAADVMVAGAADTLTRSLYAGFFRMGALSKGVCRPFHRARDGVSFGEGAGFVVLEELDQARRRGAKIYAEVAGYGMSNDAHHITAPDPNGDGFARAIRQALATTATTPERIGYVSAHGTGTQYNDLGEIRALKAVFGECARQIPVSSIKSMIGHTNGAASAIETVACCLAIMHQAIPPTANLDEPDPECDLDCVPLRGRRAHVETCLNLAAGFGGFNVCLVINRVS